MIQINARQQKQQFVKNGPVTYKYIMHVEQYSKLEQQKVLDEAAAHSGIAMPRPSFYFLSTSLST